MVYCTKIGISWPKNNICVGFIANAESIIYKKNTRVLLYTHFCKYQKFLSHKTVDVHINKLAVFLVCLRMMNPEATADKIWGDYDFLASLLNFCDFECVMVIRNVNTFLRRNGAEYIRHSILSVFIGNANRQHTVKVCIHLSTFQCCMSVLIYIFFYCRWCLSSYYR